MTSPNVTPGLGRQALSSKVVVSTWSPPQRKETKEGAWFVGMGPRP